VFCLTVPWVGISTTAHLTDIPPQFLRIPRCTSPYFARVRRISPPTISQSLSCRVISLAHLHLCGKSVSPDIPCNPACSKTHDLTCAPRLLAKPRKSLLFARGILPALPSVAVTKKKKRRIYRFIAVADCRLAIFCFLLDGFPACRTRSRNSSCSARAKRLPSISSINQANESATGRFSPQASRALWQSFESITSSYTSLVLTHAFTRRPLFFNPAAPGPKATHSITTASFRGFCHSEQSSSY